jgi:hypothetical protein
MVDEPDTKGSQRDFVIFMVGERRSVVRVAWSNTEWG